MRPLTLTVSARDGTVDIFNSGKGEWDRLEISPDGVRLDKDGITVAEWSMDELADLQVM